jgi:hypothetical protein
MELDVSLPLSQQPATTPYPEPEESTPLPPVLASHCSGITLGTPAPCATRRASLVMAGMKGTLLLRPTQFFVPKSTPIVVEWLKHHTWNSHLMRHNQCKFGRNRAVTKGTLLSRPTQFFVPNSPSIPVGWLKHHIWHSIHMRHNQCQFRRNRAVMKGTLPLRPKQFFASNSPRSVAGWLKTNTWQALHMHHN